MRKNILFINFGGLGDEILFLPAIMSVKKEFPNAHITLALEPRSKDIFDLTDVIDDIILVDIKNKNKYFELVKFLFKVWQKKFDIVISSGSNKLVSILLYLTFVKEKYGYDTGILSQKFLTKAITLNKNQYAVDMYHDLVRNLTNIKTVLPKFSITPSVVEKNTVLIHPGVSLLSIKQGMIKTVSAEIWAEVVEKLAQRGKKVILAGGADDRIIIESIINKVSSDKFINMYGKTKNLKELVKLISSAETFLCSDSAPLHIAVALGVKTYVIFGSTDETKLIPQNNKVIPIKAVNCSCPLRPCLWEKRQRTCETLECLKISADDIVEAVLS